MFDKREEESKNAPAVLDCIDSQLIIVTWTDYVS